MQQYDCRYLNVFMAVPVAAVWKDRVEEITLSLYQGLMKPKYLLSQKCVGQRPWAALSFYCYKTMVRGGKLEQNGKLQKKCKKEQKQENVSWIEGNQMGGITPREGTYLHGASRILQCSKRTSLCYLIQCWSFTKKGSWNWVVSSLSMMQILLEWYA